VAWSGTNAVSAIVEDENGKVLRKDWQIPSRGSRVMDLGEGRYLIVLPNMSPRSVTVAPGSPVKLNLEPDAPASATISTVPPPEKEKEKEKIATPPGKLEAKSPTETVKPAPKLPYVPGQFKLPPSADNLGFVLIDAGSFLMGSDPNRHRTAGLDERPQVTVDLPAFFMGKYEVTVDQYKACVDDGGCAANPSAVSGPVDRPVRYVSWDDAVQYCQWLDRKLRAQWRKWSAGLEGQAAQRGRVGKGRPWHDQPDLPVGRHH
jgi:formylglycine-generating enzyme required for sulfatase activity